MERTRNALTPRRLLLGALVALAATASAPLPAAAQFPGGPTTVTLRVVDQNGTVLNGSLVQVMGIDQWWTTPVTVTLDGGLVGFVIAPAFQGPMFPGGFALPTANNGLSRSMIVMVDGTSPTVDLPWQTAQVAVSVVDQDGAAVPGGQWGFDGEGAFYAPGTITAPVDDPGYYSDITGPSVGGWRFAVQAAFAGAPVDLFRADTRLVGAQTSALAFEWRQLTCNMGVVDATGAALRGATWTMLGHTFAEGDAITLPVTDAALYPTLGGALAAGIPTELATNTSFGAGTATFSVGADGSLSPALVDVNGGSFGLRCGVTAPPAITTGTLAGLVTRDGVPFAGAALTVVDAAAATHAVTTDAGGAFTLPDLPQGDAVVTLTVPAGTHAVDPSSGQLTAAILAGQTTNVSFSIATDTPPPPLVDNPETRDYWWRNAKAAQRGKGGHEESFEDMRVNFPRAIFDRFAQDADPVRVEGVTQVDPDGPSGPLAARPLTIDDVVATLDPSHPSALDDARSELLVILLNVVSNRLSLELVVDAQGTTLAQEIRILAAMINDGSPANDAIARRRAHAINRGHLTLRQGTPYVGRDGDSLDAGAGLDVTPATTGLAPAQAALTVARTDASLTFAMTLPEAGAVSLDVYDVTGRHVAELWRGTAPAGTTGVAWAHAGVRPGIYFARMVTPRGALSVKALVAQ